MTVAGKSTSVVINSNYFHTTDDVRYLRIDPRRNQSLAKLMMAACPANKTFRKELFVNGGAGSQVIMDLKKRADIEARSRFNIKGPRWRTRQKGKRANQLATDEFAVPLPGTNGSSGQSFIDRQASCLQEEWQGTSLRSVQHRFDEGAYCRDVRLR